MARAPATRADPSDDGPDDNDELDDVLDARPPRDLFDSPSDSWRDLEVLAALDELDPEPAERRD